MSDSDSDRTTWEYGVEGFEPDEHFILCNGVVIAHATDKETADTAIRCVNSHAALVAACRELREAAAEFRGHVATDPAGCYPPEPVWLALFNADDKAQAALSLAEEGG